jgi:hypothetical protein
MIDTREFSSLVDALHRAGRSGRRVQVEVSRDGGDFRPFGYVVDEAVANVFIKRATLVAERYNWKREYRKIVIEQAPIMPAVGDGL